MTRLGVAGQARRLASGGNRIDRAVPVRFTFGGVTYGGYRGDTLASALLANGVDQVATSIYDGRPRGVMTAGAEEPNAIVAVRTATAEEPMLRATQVELTDGLVAWGLPGVGRLSAGPDGGRFDRTHAHCETLVIGGGASGRAAACGYVIGVGYGTHSRAELERHHPDAVIEQLFDLVPLVGGS